MKVRLIKDCPGPNPDFNRKARPHPVENPHTITLPKGTEIEDEQAFRLCCLAPPVAEPIDDEAKEAVKWELERITGAKKKRKVVLADQVKRQQEAAVQHGGQSPAKS